MQVKTELQGLFTYSYIPIIITLVILIIIFFIYIIKVRKKKIKKRPNIVKPSVKNMNEIRQKYLNNLDGLLQNINNNKISNRHAYQILSATIRHFVYDSTNIKVQNYSLSEIKDLNMPILYELINEYYDPEFSKISKGNIIDSIDKAREVIKKWN